MQAEAVVAQEAKGTYQHKLLKDIAVTAIGSLLIVFCIRFFCISLFYIPTPSMHPALVEGDNIAVNLMAYGLGFGPDSPFPNVRWWYGGVERGDVAVFVPPVQLSTTVAVKRVTGIPGDSVSFAGNSFVLPSAGDNISVQIQDSASWLYSVRREGRSVHFYDGAVVIDGERTTKYTYQNDHYFMVGDNRTKSYDSRKFGTVLDQDIVGKAVFVYWSTNEHIPGRSFSVIR